MTPRGEVYEVINGERDHQERKWPAPDIHSNVEWLVYIRDYVEESLHFASRNGDPMVLEQTQTALRKIAALAVAAMEQNGARPR